ncbi:MAG TPA: FAD-dependent oxidoreductase [Vicinamibacterales bacterium]|nr:FAD-dependent oxidoreductase [Vicinamibacterales bacterium]
MPLGQRAAVIGGSMAGLLAARVLADHFEEVILIERDVFPADVADRKGVPQGRHAHALLSSGRQTLEDLFPGFADELIANGGLRIDLKQVRWFDNGGYQARATGIQALAASRPFLESHVRWRVRAIPNVRLLDAVDVDSLVMSVGNRRVEGVRTKPMKGGPEQTIECQLTVDATGRGSQTPSWLHAAGYPKPVEEVVSVGLGYSTRIFRRKASDVDCDMAVIIPSAPPDRRGAAMLALEGDRWMVTLFGLLGDHPPTDHQGYLEFARSLPAPDIYNVIRDAEPLTDPLPFKYPASCRRRYENLDRFPDGYLVFGDAICSFNPVYGQGMSVAALQARALASSLNGGREGLAKRFFTAAAKVVDNPWLMAVGGDLRYPTVEGPRTAMGNFVNWYLGKLHIASRKDPALTLAFHTVANLLADPPTLLKPNIAYRVARGNIFH